MATYTENYNLAMPEEADFYNVGVFNENFEAIDTVMAETESGINEVNDKIGTTDDKETGSVFGKLNALQNIIGNGFSIIKSIQHFTTRESKTFNIQTVNPDKCIVILERLEMPIQRHISLTYTLNATTLVTTFDSDNYGGSAGFWIIEFN